MSDCPTLNLSPCSVEFKCGGTERLKKRLLGGQIELCDVDCGFRGGWSAVVDPSLLGCGGIEGLAKPSPGCEDVDSGFPIG